jgi:hypothetical protein
VNGKIAKPGTIVRNGDRIQYVGLFKSVCDTVPNVSSIFVTFDRNMVHRHEPPVTSTPVQILKQEPDYLVINKPGSIARIDSFSRTLAVSNLLGYSRSMLRAGTTNKA